MNEVKIKTEIIKLDSFLKYVGAVNMGSDAKMYIKNGEVKVNGEIEIRRGKKLTVGDEIEFEDIAYKII
jgi:ribosome-associated protein